MAIFGRNKVTKTYFYVTTTRPPTAREAKQMAAEDEYAEYDDLYHSLIVFVLKDKEKPLYKGNASKFLELYDQARKPNVPLIKLDGGYVPPDLAEVVNTKKVSSMTYVLNATDMLAKHKFESELKKPLQEDRYFVFLPFGLPDSDILIGTAIYFCD